ncbi:MAG: hypothetical protein H0W53_05330 [Acidobacteria bacterium]|nr:hypothetical protein [Acidobacteriota bacterium]
MKVVFSRMLCVSALVFAVASLHGQTPQSSGSKDPRVGLKAGLKDAGVAASNMELVANLPKPPGFFDPKEPAGSPTAAEKPVVKPDPNKPATEKPAAEEPAVQKPATEKPAVPPGSGLNYANSDLAFRGTNLIAGNFSGFNVYDISTPAKAQLIASVVCPGGQGDVSIRGNLLIMSVEQTRGRLDCGTAGVEEPVSPVRFRGIRIFDITDIRKPQQLAAVQTCRGSHTHTLLEDPDDKANIYVYGSGTSAPRSPEELAGCSDKKPEEDPNTSYYNIDVIQIPLANPAAAEIVSQPRIFSDSTTGAIAGLNKKGDHGPGTQTTSETNQCHDITVFPEVGLAAGACSGNGILLDISDPVKPVRLDAAADKNFAYWHSATFNNDGTKVIFTDEWGGGTRPRCRITDQPEWGANAIFDIVDRKLQFRSYYKLPAPQTEFENCVAHNGSLVPVPGRDIMVQAWYQGGVSVFDFTDSAKPFEIAYFDRGPVDAKQLFTAGLWSTYWYNGYIYGTEMARGLDIYQLRSSPHLSQNELEAARLVRYDVFNPQQQPRVVHQVSPTVARAYLDQLTRRNALPAARVSAITAALSKPDPAELDPLAAQLQQDASSASGQTAEILTALAETLKGIR